MLNRPGNFMSRSAADFIGSFRDILQKVLELPHDKFKKAIPYKSLCFAYYRNCEYDKAIEAGNIALKNLNEKIPKNFIEYIMFSAKELIILLLQRNFKKIFVKKSS